MDRWIRNFVWTEDVNSKKIVTIAWGKIRPPISAGGLGLRSLKALNKATSVKLCWDMINSKVNWACLVKARFLRYNIPIKYHRSSSIWGGFREHYDLVFGKIK